MNASKSTNEEKMSFYVVKNAFNTEFGPQKEYSEAYEDDFEFSAINDQGAIQHVETKQSDHDKVYREAGASDNDYENAPCYVANLYRAEPDGEFTKIEI